MGGNRALVLVLLGVVALAGRGTGQSSPLRASSVVGALGAPVAFDTPVTRTAMSAFDAGLRLQSATSVSDHPAYGWGWNASQCSVPAAPLLTGSSAGLTASLAWSASAPGGAPADYVLEAGDVPGAANLANTVLPASTTSLMADAPAGTYYVRVRARNACGSAVSNEVVLTLASSCVLPEAPGQPVATVAGGSVSVSWTPGVGATTHVFEAGSLPGASNLVNIPVSAPALTAQAPLGVYFVRARGQNACGVGPASADARIAVGCEAPGSAAPLEVTVSGVQVSLAWSAASAATDYVLEAGTSSGDGNLAQLPVAATSFVASVPPGTYYVRVRPRNACGSGDWSNEAVITTEAPGAPDWTAVMRQGADHIVSWMPVSGADRYRVFWATSRQTLLEPTPTAAFVETTAPPLQGRVPVPSGPVYYRVVPMSGPSSGDAGPIAVATEMDAVDVPVTFVSPALWDVNGDGCLDVVGAWGTCDGRFQAYPLEDAGLEGLFAQGRSSRDSRFADFTGDGIVDIFTNVYARADDTASRAILHVGSAGGRFAEDSGVKSLEIGGFGETVLAADFDNDGDVDIFVPHYTHLDDGGHNWLLINDGTGRFTDVAQSAGVATNLYLPPEGAQAIDFNEDGWVDIHVASHLFINNGDLTFTDRAADVQLPIWFDEGMRFFDIDLDGDFDLVHHDGSVTRLSKNEQGIFEPAVEVDGSPDGSTYGFGLNVCDVNGDGFEDVLVANNSSAELAGQLHLLINAGGTLVRSDFVSASTALNDLVACADLDRSGLPDVLARWNGYRSLINRATSNDTIRLRVVGDQGERNQQGRIVRVKPLTVPGRTMLRVVESGSGYMAQNDYDLLIAAPWPGDYEVSVRFADGWVRTTVRAGDNVTIGPRGPTPSALR